MQKYEEFLEWQNLFLCVGEKGASVIMLGVPLVGQHHIGRGIKGRLVQYCIGGHKVGIDIQQLVVACQFQAALTSSTLLHLGIAQASLALLSTCATPATVVVGIVAVMFVIHGSVHTVRSTRSRATAVFRPAEEAPGLKLATRVVSSARSSGTCTIAVCSTSVAGRSHPLRQENKGVKPHGFRAVYPFGFMC